VDRASRPYFFLLTLEGEKVVPRFSLVSNEVFRIYTYKLIPLVEFYLNSTHAQALNWRVRFRCSRSRVSRAMVSCQPCPVLCRQILKCLHIRAIHIDSPKREVFRKLFQDSGKAELFCSDDYESDVVFFAQRALNQISGSSFFELRGVWKGVGGGKMLEARGVRFRHSKTV